MRIEGIRFRNFQADDVNTLVEIQKRALQKCQDTGQFETGFWLSPGFQGGKNIIIAQDAELCVWGYAAISSAYYSNVLEARVFWIDLRTDPEVDPNLVLKDTLLNRIIQRGRVMKVEENRERAAVVATYFAEGEASIEYLKMRGFKHFETMLAMGRELDMLPLRFPVSQEINIKSWRMETREDKQAYLDAREIAFGYPLQTLKILEHFTLSELWQNGTTFTAFAGDKIIGSVMVLSNGMLDYVFVHPEWRGKGIAKALVSRAIEFLKERDHSQAWLEVYSHNQAAVNLYQSFGFESFKKEISLGLLLD